MTPNKQYLMVGHCDQKLRMVNTLSWKEVFAFDHSLSELNENNSTNELNIYVESETVEDGPLYEAVGKPFKLERLTSPEMGQMTPEGLPRVGISKLAISHDSNYIATVCE
jgi:hypothetical protein